MAEAVKGTGCYKCGRPGHWSRDCPSAPASTASTPAPSRVGGSSGTPQSSQGYKRKDAPGDSDKSTPGAKGKGAEKAPPRSRGMPKLTPELLLSGDGLGYVLEKIPRQVSIKGRGHEVEDLKSLLEAYVRWHSQLLPYYAYSQFVEKVEKLGANKRIRMCVRDLRLKIAIGEEPESADMYPDASKGDPFLDTELDTQPPNQGDTVRGWGDEADVAEDHADPPMDVLDEYLQQASDSGAQKQPEAAPTHACRPTLLVGQEVNKESDQGIKEEQRVRMEANKLKALERARARKLELEKSLAPA